MSAIAKFFVRLYSSYQLERMMKAEQKHFMEMVAHDMEQFKMRILYLENQILALTNENTPPNEIEQAKLCAQTITTRREEIRKVKEESDKIKEMLKSAK